MEEVIKIMATSSKSSHAGTTQLSAPDRAPGHSRPMPLPDSWILTDKSGSVFCGVTAPFSWVLVHTKFCLCPSGVCFPHPV